MRVWSTRGKVNQHRFLSSFNFTRPDGVFLLSFHAKQHPEIFHSLSKPMRALFAYTPLRKYSIKIINISLLPEIKVEIKVIIITLSRSTTL